MTEPTIMARPLDCKGILKGAMVRVMARRSIYDETKARKLLRMIAEGGSLEKTCAAIGWNPGTVACWAIRDTPKGFRAKYFEAFGAKILLEADRSLAIVDEVAGSNSMPEVLAAKNRVDLRRFLASRLLPELSDRLVDQSVHQTATVHVYLPSKAGGPPVIEGRAERIDDKSE